MSGFFVLDRRFLLRVAPRLSGVGFQDPPRSGGIVPDAGPLAEVPYTFRARQHGESKLDIVVGLEYIYLLLDKPHRPHRPSAVRRVYGRREHRPHHPPPGSPDVFSSLAIPFLEAQAIGTGVVIAINFWLNNIITFRDRRFRGARLWRGLAIYYLGCSVGVLINLAVARFGANAGAPWYASGTFGLAVSAVWNYWVSSVFTWRPRLETPDTAPPIADKAAVEAGSRQAAPGHQPPR